MNRVFPRRTAPVVLLMALVATCHAADPTVPTTPALDWTRERQFWSFQPPVAHHQPAVRLASWPRQPIDAFILHRLEARDLSPSPETDRRTFLRRVTLDLTGLPPTVAEMDAFLADPGRDAFERVIDRLLESPRLGERLASLWLPLVRYAEDQAHQVGDDTTYFYPNAHRYRGWVIDAFNRDLPYNDFLRFQLAADRVSAATADDLAALGLLGLGPKYYNRGRIEVMADEWEDRVDTVTRSMLGLTVACARCHDHKFEPVTMDDYYGLAGVFASTRMSNRGPDGREERNGTSAPNMQADTLHIVTEGSPEDLPVFLRGNPTRKGPIAERQFPRILRQESDGRFLEGSGRKELAAAIASRGNPLTARVWVNRLWGLLFGSPLVPTPSNFGRSGRMPTHPELLDDLAVRFMDGGWSTKAVLREFALSATYRQTSRTSAAHASKDPANDLLGRMNRRRLSIEQWRDSLLAVGGDLELEDGRSRELTDPANRRRTVFARISRLQLNDLLLQFDYPDANVHAEGRSSTTTAIQKLFVLNSPFMLERAQRVAALMTASQGSGPAGRAGSGIRATYERLYGRPPDAKELALGEGFLDGDPDSLGTRWEQYAQVLLAANEMLYVD